MGNFDTTLQSTKYVASLLAGEDTMFVMDSLLSAKEPEKQEYFKVYLRKLPPSYAEGGYIDEVFSIVSRHLLENEVILQIESTTTKEKYYISETLFELNYKEMDL